MRSFDALIGCAKTEAITTTTGEIILHLRLPTTATYAFCSTELPKRDAHTVPLSSIC